MTTKVKITASGPCYPARVRIFNKNDDLVTELVVSDGFSWETWLSQDHRMEIVEEYWPEGYKI